MVKKITIDSLARMTQNEFSRIGERFDSFEARVDVRFDKVDNTLNELREGQKQLLDLVLDIPSKKAFNRLEIKVDSLDARLTSVERKVK